MKLWAAIFPVFIFNLSYSLAQHSKDSLTIAVLQDTSTKKHLPDSTHLYTADVTARTKKHFWRAAGTWALLEALPLTFDRYVANKDYARISFKTIGDHLSIGSWEWDDDGFTENQFGHPYHGNLFFNSFRNNGYSYWQSAAAGFAGSLFWEIVAENQAPAPNDLINTTFGGMTLGEMTYRIAHKIINPRKRGIKRQSREIFATMINPVMGFTRAVNGQWGKVNDNPDYEDPAHVEGTLDGGLRRIDTKTNNVFQNGKNAAFIRLALQYADSTASLNTPFREFYARMELGMDDSAKINNITVFGSLAAWDIGGTENSIQRLLLSINYDLYHNSAFYFGGQGFNINWQSHYYMPRGSDLTTIFGIGAIALAAVPDRYLQYGSNRRYDYGSGLSLLSNVTYILHKKFIADFVYRGGLVKTINGNTSSDYFLNSLAVDAGYRFYKTWSIHAEYDRFALNGHFENNPNYSSQYPVFRVFLRYLINK